MHWMISRGEYGGCAMKNLLNLLCQYQTAYSAIDSCLVLPTELDDLGLKIFLAIF